MNDIAMCAHNGCPKSKECRRHQDSGAVPDTAAQTWADFPAGDDCYGFWPVKFDMNESIQRGQSLPKPCTCYTSDDQASCRQPCPNAELGAKKSGAEITVDPSPGGLEPIVTDGHSALGTDETLVKAIKKGLDGWLAISDLGPATKDIMAVILPLIKAREEARCIAFGERVWDVSDEETHPDFPRLPLNIPALYRQWKGSSDEG